MTDTDRLDARLDDAIVETRRCLHDALPVDVPFLLGLLEDERLGRAPDPRVGVWPCSTPDGPLVLRSKEARRG